MLALEETCFLSITAALLLLLLEQRADHLLLLLSPGHGDISSLSFSATLHAAAAPRRALASAHLLCILARAVWAYRAPPSLVGLIARLDEMLRERLVVVRDTCDLSRFSGASPISCVQVRPVCEGRTSESLFPHRFRRK